LHWLLLSIAGILEVVWAAGLKASEGFSRFWPSALTVVAAVGSFWLLSLAMRHLPLGTAYGVWTGIGALGAFVVGVTIMGEPAGLLRVISAALLLTGIIGLKLTSV
jgi:quaternary ammonium compound-resistance protein SugE